MEDPNKEKLKQELQNMIQNIDFEKDKYSVLWEVRDKIERIQFKFAPLSSNNDWN